MKLKKLMTEENSSDELMKDLEKQFKKHDWFYGFSDDKRYYDSGKQEWEEIKKTLQKIHDAGEAKEARKLFDKYTKGMQYMHYPIK